MSALVVTDLGDGDACWSVVDDALWAQICVYAAEDSPRNTSDFCELIVWLVTPEAEWALAGPPPERAGSVLKTFCTQTYAPEAVSLDGVKGILTLPG